MARRHKRRRTRWIKSALGVRRRRRGLGAHHRKSVRVEARRKGALHRFLKVSAGEKIPLVKLRKAKRRVERLLERGRKHATARRWLRRINLALTLRRFKHRRRK